MSDESGQLSVDQDGNCGYLVDAAFLYLTECRYPERSSDSDKRKKVPIFVLRHGEIIFKNQKNGKV